MTEAIGLLSCLDAGLRLEDIDKLDSDFDIRDRNLLYKTIPEYEHIKLLRLKLTIADAVYHAMVGATPGSKKKSRDCARVYNNWARENQNTITVMSGKKLATVFDKIEKQGRKSHIIN